MLNILICDDERDIRNALAIYLRAEGYGILEAENGEEALKVVQREQVHLILMDIMMPVMDGVTATAKIREESNVPVIFLSAKGEDMDKILGLNVGADDYVTKPFNPVELIARVRAQLRRYTALGGMTKRDGVMSIGTLVLDDEAKSVTNCGEPVSLTPTEYDILRLLMRSPGKVYSSSEIYKAVWKDDPFGAEGTVAVHIRHLREKIEINPAEPSFIKVVWGKGYKLSES